MSITIDGLDALLSTFQTAPANLEAESLKVVSKGALNIKVDAQQRVQAGLHARSHLPHYARSISYDLLDGGLTAEIGPDPTMIQGRFGRGIEFGSSHAGPIPHMLPAADAEMPRFIEALRLAAAGAL